jgi:peptidoglycan hydrolase-like protein with peptidoglycan-binding domain
MRRYLQFIVLVATLLAAPSSHAQDYASAAQNFPLESGDDIRDLQVRLSLLGYFDGIADEGFSKRLFAAIQTFQIDRGQMPTGMLADEDLQQINLESNALLQRLGFAKVSHFAGRFSVRLPTALLPRKLPTRRGVAYESDDKLLSVDVSIFKRDEISFKDLFLRLTSQSGVRVVDSKILLDTLFAVIGHSNGRHFYSRYMFTYLGHVGITISWDDDRLPGGKAIALAIANSMVLGTTPQPQLADTPTEAGVGGPFVPLPIEVGQNTAGTAETMFALPSGTPVASDLGPRKQ